MHPDSVEPRGSAAPRGSVEDLEPKLGWPEHHPGQELEVADLPW